MSTHEQNIQNQFDPRAQAYLNSTIHACGPDLVLAKSLVAQAVPAAAYALDVGCGAGHLSFALASHVARMVALDTSPNMLATVKYTAAARGLGQIETNRANAESLPFKDSCFSLACTRYSAHHWRRLHVALREMVRVLAPGGRLLVIDTLGQEDPLVDTFMQSMELLRDPSHVRNRSKAEWRSVLQPLGLAEVNVAEWPTRLEFASWVERMRTPADLIAGIRSLQKGAPREVREALAIEPDGSFTIRTGLFWLQKFA